MSVPAVTHTLRVQRLYRSALKNLANWTVHRDLWISEGFKLRAEFDANKGVTNPNVIEKLLSDGEAKLADMTHPDPYTGAQPGVPGPLAVSPPRTFCAAPSPLPPRLDAAPANLFQFPRTPAAPST